MMHTMTRFWQRLWTTGLLMAFLALLTWAVMPEEALAKRMGGGGSFGSRGSQSYSAPKEAPAQRSASAPQSSSPAVAAPSRPGFMGGLMGGIGGFLLGGMLGALLFGNLEGGIGLLDILILGGVVFLVIRFLKNRAGRLPQAEPQPAGVYRKAMEEEPVPSWSTSSTRLEMDEVTRGLSQITAMDPRFREETFLDGARRAFDMLQEAWSHWQVDRLRPFVTDPMWQIIQAQDQARQQTGHKDVVENIQYRTVEVSQAWQEAGQDWITVHFLVNMLEYAVNERGEVVEGSRQQPVTVEEYWTFCRPVGAANPNWLLTAIQQPGQVVSPHAM